MNRSSRFLRSIGVGYASQVVITVVGLWLTPFLLDRLGQRELGLWLVGTQLLGYLGLLDVGIIAMLPRESAYARARDQQPGAPGGELQYVVGRTARVALWQLAAMCLVAVAGILLVPEGWRELRGPLTVVFAVFALTFPFRILHGVLLGLQDLTFVGIASFLQWATTTVLTVVLMLMGFRLWSMAYGWAAGQLLATALWMFRFALRFPEVLPRRVPRLSLSEVRALFGRGVWFSVSQVSSALLLSTDLLIIGHVLGPAAVVPYSVTGKLIQVLSNQPQLLVSNAIPALAELHELRDRERVRRASGAVVRLLLLGSSAVVCAALAVNRGFVGWWVGPEQYAGDLLTVAILGSMLLRHAQLTTAFMLHAYGRYDRFSSLTMLTDGAVTVVSGALLVRWLGPIGAPLGSILGASLVSLPLSFRVIARELGISQRELAMQYVSVGARLLPTAVAILLVVRRWPVDTLPGIILAGVLAGIAYAATMFPMLTRPPLDAYVAPRLAWIRRVLHLGTGRA